MVKFIMLKINHKNMAFCSNYICHKMNCRSYAHYLLEVTVLFSSAIQWYYTTNFYFDMGSGNSTCYSEAQSDDKDEFKKPNAPSARVLTRRESCLSTYRWANQHEIMWHSNLRIYSMISNRLVFIFSNFSTENQHVIEPPIIFGAFNIQSFGVAKMSNERAVKAIVKIIRHFDIIVLQEIVDKSEKAINKLLDEVNNGLHSSARYIIKLWLCLPTTSC